MEIIYNCSFGARCHEGLEDRAVWVFSHCWTSKLDRDKQLETSPSVCVCPPKSNRKLARLQPAGDGTFRLGVRIPE